MDLIGYARVVPMEDATGALQHQCERIESFCQAAGHQLVSTFQEQIGGETGVADREQLRMALESAQPGMGLVVVRLDRLSSSKKVLSAILDECKRREISIIPTAGPKSIDEMKSSLEVTVIANNKK